MWILIEIVSFMKMHRDSILYWQSLDGLRSLYNTDHEEPCLLHSTGHVEEDSNHRHDYGLSTIRGSRAVHQQHWKVFQEFILKGSLVRIFFFKFCGGVCISMLFDPKICVCNAHCTKVHCSFEVTAGCQQRQVAKVSRFHCFISLFVQLCIFV